MTLCEKFYLTSDMFTAPNSMFELPTEWDETDQKEAKLLSLTNVFVINTLTNLHNKEMASDDTPCSKFLIVSLYATGMILGGLICGTVEGTIRIAVTLFSLPCLFCEDYSMLPTLMGYSILENFGHILWTPIFAYQFFTEPSDISLWD